MVHSVHGWLRRLPAWAGFPLVGGEDDTRRRLELARILVGLVVVWRASRILLVAHPWYGPDADRVVALLAVQVTLALLVSLGTLTPVALGALALTVFPTDVELVTTTLGTQVLSMLLLVLLLAGAGRRMSVDAVLLRAGPAPVRRLLALIRRPFDAPGPEDLRLALWVGFVAYGVVSFAALTFHVRDAYWLSGETVRVMFSSAYMSSVSGLVRSLERSVGPLVAAGSALAVIGQTVFQGGMLFLVRWRTGRRFVAWWGWGFFLVSLIGIRISYLPHVEVVLWFVLFGPPWRIPRAAHVATSPTRAGLARAVVVPLLVVPYLLIGVLSPLPNLARAASPGAAEDLAWILRPVEKAARTAGFAPPNVFNVHDLRMGDRWAVIYRLDGASREPLGFTSPSDGSRQHLQRSDAVYFGNTLAWRRKMIDRDVVAAHEVGELGWRLIAQRVAFDVRSRALTTAEYEIEVWQHHGSDTSVPAPERYEPELIHRFRVRAVADGSVVDVEPAP